VDLRAVKAARRAELSACAFAAARNAQGLLHDAEVLAGSGCAARAYSLAALAVELPISTTIMLRAIAAVAQQEGKFPYATVGPSCAPWDGPANELHLSTTPLKCRQSDVIEVTISFWRDLPLHDNQTFSLDPKSNWGGASYCRGGHQPCERATSGSIHMETISQGKSARG